MPSVERGSLTATHTPSTPELSPLFLPATGRVIFWHCCAFHALLMIAFWEADWDNLSVVCITHALGKIVRQLIDAGRPPAAVGGVGGAEPGRRALQSLTEHVSICLLYSLIPICYFTEKAPARRRPAADRTTRHQLVGSSTRTT